jgi:centromeric protein E
VADLRQLHRALHAALHPLRIRWAKSPPFPPADQLASDSPASFAEDSLSVLADRIFGEDCRTAEVYEARTKHIVDSVVRGFNGNSRSLRLAVGISVPLMY